MIEKMENKNSMETKKIIAKDLNLPVENREVTRPQANDTYRMELTLTAEQFQKLELVKKQLSHQFPQQKNAEIFEYLFDLVLQKKTAKKKGAEDAQQEPLEMAQSLMAATIENEKTLMEKKSTQSMSNQKKNNHRMNNDNQSVSATPPIIFYTEVEIIEREAVVCN